MQTKQAARNYRPEGVQKVASTYAREQEKVAKTREQRGNKTCKDLGKKEEKWRGKELGKKVSE